MLDEPLCTSMTQAAFGTSHHSKFTNLLEVKQGGLILVATGLEQVSSLFFLLTAAQDLCSPCTAADQLAPSTGSSRWQKSPSCRNKAELGICHWRSRGIGVRMVRLLPKPERWHFLRKELQAK